MVISDTIATEIKSVARTLKEIFKNCCSLLGIQSTSVTEEVDVVSSDEHVVSSDEHVVSSDEHVVSSPLLDEVDEDTCSKSDPACTTLNATEEGSTTEVSNGAVTTESIVTVSVIDDAVEVSNGAVTTESPPVVIEITTDPYIQINSDVIEGAVTS